jgi:hypothetical protein
MLIEKYGKTDQPVIIQLLKLRLWLKFGKNHFFDFELSSGSSFSFTGAYFGSVNSTNNSYKNERC